MNCFKLKISSLREAYQLQEWATHVISLLDPDFWASYGSQMNTIKLPGENLDHQQVQRYYFHDLTKEDSSMVWVENPKLARAEQIQDILKFTASLQATDKLLIYCHAGISRSTAVACGVLCQHNLTPSEAIEYVLSIRPPALPNSYVLSLFDQELKLEGKLVTTVEERLDKNYQNLSAFLKK